MRLVFVGILLPLLASCGTAPTPDPAAPTRSAADSQASSGATAPPSPQPWGKPYLKTSCGDFEDRMSSRQRHVMVSAILTGLRSRDGDRSRPADVVVDGFEAAMADSCSAVPGSYGVDDVATGVYLTQRAHWRP